MSQLLRRDVTPEMVCNAMIQASNQCSLGPEESFLLGRILALEGGSGNAEANIYRECGYLINPRPRNYHDLYARGGIATRVVNIWPDECWSEYPELYETEQKRVTKFERAWDRLSKRVMPWHYLHRADRLSGIGRFGIMLLGVGDGKSLQEPAAELNHFTGEYEEPKGEYELLYLRAFDESLVRVESWEMDTSSPRYMHPLRYAITFPTAGGLTSEGNPLGAGSVENLVHWTRVIHLADNRESSEIWGVPRMQPVLNLLHDIFKVQGGSAEMFWKGGFPGYAFEAFPNELGVTDVDKPSLKKEIVAYTRGLQRYLTTAGGKWNSLAVQVANPKNHIEQYLTLMSATIGVPMRIMLGSEQGQLASTQDTSAWKERLRGRQINYLEPLVVRPFVGRLMGIGVLPRVKDYMISWRDLRALSDKDRADVALKQVQALMQYITGGCNQLLPEHMLYTMVMGFTESQASAVAVELAKNPPKQLMPPATAVASKAADNALVAAKESPTVPQSQSGGRKGQKPAKSKGGKPTGTRPEGAS